MSCRGTWARLGLVLLASDIIVSLSRETDRFRRIG